MSRVRRAVYIQVGGLALIGVLLFLASRFFPVADWIAQVQQKVMHLGAWSAIWYPLLYAGCNVLLLPGGLLSIGGGFFFGLWWGFLIVLIGNVGGAAISFVLSRWIGRRWLRRKLLRNRNPGGFGTSRGTRRLEDHLVEPVASTFSDQPAQLSLWTNHGPIQDVYTLGSDRASAGIVLVHLCRHLGTARPEFGAWEKSPAGD